MLYALPRKQIQRFWQNMSLYDPNDFHIQEDTPEELEQMDESMAITGLRLLVLWLSSSRDVEM
ncbi:hypothetical protein N7509_012162 [Penicillium cosmopolitanum]|uniref:Uncharacterized protein n=1 Tax=Penicillium cosmopolitanum TaxID=1131564 RepID=A0A9W9VED6_9EURO|nr:uncharacterized protein N7509_012162 [Penicillium cosmopolitanum]KAJ5379043.1 hypothetical protein N7509_012162 [Penicillium cosmopolitanum]